MSVGAIFETAAFVFDPPRFDTETGELHLPYRFAGGPAFVERFAFGPPLDPPSADRLALVERLARYLHVAAGVSYYKALVPERLDVGALDLDAAAAAFFRTLYLHGLGEFAHRNDLDLRDRLRFHGASAERAPIRVALPRRALVPIGGGKDSLVTVELLRSVGEPLMLFAVNPKGPMRTTAAASGFDVVTVTRRLDPALMDLNARGAFNGHVPITAIVSLAALVAAVWHGFDRVVMSNERSADVGNLDARGFEVNHQWSKSRAFEALLRDELCRAISPDLDWFSLLRPLSELAIAERFARSTRYDTSFSSCNRNFHLAGDGPAGRWCRDCPKCRFVFLALAPFAARDRLVGCFGGDLLDDGTQAEGFRELLGLDGHKPFECVGEIEEAQAALLAIGDRRAWQESRLVAKLGRELRARGHAPRASLERLVADRGPGFVPADLASVLAR